MDDQSINPHPQRCYHGMNNSVKRLKVRSDCGEEEMRSLLQALPGNMGIEHLILVDVHEMIDETWCLLFRSLVTNPRIECVDFEDYFNWGDLKQNR
jgi:hypothetical protein